MQQDETNRFESSVSADKKGLGQRVAEGVSAAAQTAGERVDATLDYAQSTAHNVKDRMTNLYNEDFRDLRDRALEYTRKQPLSALLIAAGVGIVLGWLTRRDNK
jgi:ElaB/YqjD/DUF883 family membrane-anchored ribosome-binding protein